MNSILAGAFLLILKFVLIGLIYWVLLLVLRAVRREMSLRIESASQDAAIVPGRLRIVNPGGGAQNRQGEIVNLRPETTIGADADNILVLTDPYVSGRHASLRWDGTKWWVEDLGSRNGTFVDQIQLPPYTPQPVPAGATLQIGGVVLVLMD